LVDLFTKLPWPRASELSEEVDTPALGDFPFFIYKNNAFLGIFRLKFNFEKLFLINETP